MASDVSQRKPGRQPIDLRVGSPFAGCHLEHDGPEQGNQLAVELARIFPGFECVRDDAESGARIGVGERVRQAEYALTTGNAEQIADVVRVDRVIAIGVVLLAIRCQLIQQSQRIAHTASRMLADHIQSVPFDRHAFLLGHAREMLDNGCTGESLEIESLASRDDGRQKLFGIGGRQNELGVRRRFLECFQERVRGGARDLMRFVDDVELGFQECRRELNPFPEFSNIVDTPIAGGVDLDDVGRGASIDRHTSGATVAGTRVRIRIETIDGFRQQTRGSCLAGAARSGKQIRMGDPIEPDSIPEGANDRVLTDQIIGLEGLRPVFPIE